MEWQKYKQSDEAGRLEIEELEKMIGLRESDIVKLRVDLQVSRALDPGSWLTFKQKKQFPTPPSLAAGSSTARRTTTTAALAREEYELALAQHQDTGDSWEKLQHVSPKDAWFFIQEKSRDPVCEKQGAFGCWIPKGRHAPGYISAQITVTRKDPDRDYRELGGPKIVVNSRLHVLAMLSKDAQGDPKKYGLAHQALKGAHRYGTHHTSHLCHNNHCFNPAHLVVETCALNLARNKCQGHQILRIFYPSPNGGYQDTYLEWHPCRHGVSENRALCILPVREIRVPIVGYDGIPAGVKLERGDWMFKNGQHKAWDWWRNAWSRETTYEAKTWREDGDEVD
jgi:hypothetical protein